MQTFVLIDAQTGLAIGASQSTAPEYEPHENEIPCSVEQFNDPTRWAYRDGALVPSEPPPPPAAPAITYKADIYRRCTDDEADAIEMALAAALVRQRRLFESALHLDHSDEAFAFAQKALIEMFGETRAAQLLATS